ncbi:MAG: hypothetical protein H0V07_04860, partial [Propionibacteriales bacterium]|nr:hypothetical protein [Propionibacteriales bacterium]
MRLLRYKGQRPEVLSLGQGAGAIIQVTYGQRVVDSLHLGPNEVNWVVTHEDGTYELSGPSFNLITNGGKDYVSAALGGALGFGVSGTIATASSATSLTGTASPFVASAY